MSAQLLLLNYLRAGDRFGANAGVIDMRFCRESLRIPDPEAVVADLQRQGHPIKIDNHGNILVVRGRTA